MTLPDKIDDTMGRVLEFRPKDKPIDTGGRPPYDGGMDTRVTKLEVSVNYIERDIKTLVEDVRASRNDIAAIRTTDFRIMYGTIIAAVLGLAGVMAKGFGWL